ncbi:hypothetical protein [Spiroplasma endosymbiont of Cleonymus obscurus]
MKTELIWTSTLQNKDTQIIKKPPMPIQNWNTAIAHFMIKFEDRINLN